MVQFLDDGLRPNLPPVNGMPSFVAPTQSMQTMTPEILDAIISDPNQHVDIKAKAEAMKASMFPNHKSPTNYPTLKDNTQSPTYGPFTQPIMQQSPVTVTPQAQTEIRQSPATFESLLQAIQIEKATPFTEIAQRLSTGEPLFIRSMRVKEYKFMAKNFDAFEKSLDDSTANLALEYLRLYRSVDEIIMRCVSNGPTILPSLYWADWLYLMIILRCISRGSTAKFKYFRDEKEESVTIDLGKLVSDIHKHRQEFTENFKPSEIQLSNGQITVWVYPLRVQDRQHAESFILARNEDVSVYTALSMRESQLRGHEKLQLTPEQSVQLFDLLLEDDLNKIEKAFSEKNDFVLKFIDTWIEKETGIKGEIFYSDFLLFFCGLRS